MAKFLLQSESNGLGMEEYIAHELLKKDKITHSYQKASLSDTDRMESGLIPIGSIEFVTKYIGRACNPIEIPAYLRTGEFLKRSYRIVEYAQIPEEGEFFLKDASVLKGIAGIVRNLHKGSLDKSHLFQISSLLPIEAEYRVYVLQGEIENIICYNGDCTMFPDIKLIRKAVGLINRNEKWLRSFTIDVAVGNFGMALIEVHNLLSVGLYSTLWGGNLLYGYRDGIEYVRNDNRACSVWP